jgi:predicted RNase H-like HicB family nuclease
MSQTYTAVVKQDGQWWIGWIQEVPGVNCQERTRDELVQSLRITLGEALEMNRADARDAAGKGYEELTIAVSSVATCCDTSHLMAARSFEKVATTPGGTTHLKTNAVRFRVTTK